MTDDKQPLKDEMARRVAKRISENPQILDEIKDRLENDPIIDGEYVFGADKPNEPQNP